MNRFNVTIGRDFDIKAFEIHDVGDVNELSKIEEWRSSASLRASLSYWILGSIAGALIFATAIGLYDGSFDEVGFVWSAAALPLGCILRSYFEKPVPP